MTSPDFAAILLLHAPDKNDAIQEGLRRQALLGGALDTNLLELEVFEEAAILSALSQASNLSPVSRTDFDDVLPFMPRLFPCAFAEAHQLVPLALVGSTLEVAVANIPDAALMKSIENRLQLDLQLFITSEARLSYAMHRLYGKELSPRFVSLLQALDAGPTDDAFTASQPAPAQETTSLKSVPIPSPASMPMPKDQRVGPHDPQSQVARIAQAHDRDSVVDILLGYALALFEHAGLFLIQDDAALGWRGPNSEVNSALSKISVPLHLPSIFQTLYATRGHYLGPLPSNTINQQIFAALGRPLPKTAFLAPIMVGSKLAAILMADNAGRGMGPKKIAALLLLMQHAGLAFERIIVQQKNEAKNTYVPKLQAVTRQPNTPLSFALLDTMTGQDVSSNTVDASSACSARPQQLDGAYCDAATQGDGAFDKSQDKGWPASEPDKDVAIPDATHEPLERLFDALDAQDQHVRHRAIAALKAFGRTIDEALRQRFCGVLAYDPFAADNLEAPPACHQLSGMMALLVARGADAIDVVLPQLEADAPLKRWAALSFFAAVYHPPSLDALARRLNDTDGRVRLMAVDVLGHYAQEPGYKNIVSDLCRQISAPSLVQSMRAVQLLGQMREPLAVPALIPLVTSDVPQLARAAASALAVLCGQSFGTDLGLWQQWWQRHYTRPRTDWLLGGLEHANIAIRRVAHNELKRLCGIDVEFDAAAPREARERGIGVWFNHLAPRQDATTKLMPGV